MRDPDIGHELVQADDLVLEWGDDRVVQVALETTELRVRLRSKVGSWAAGERLAFFVAPGIRHSATTDATGAAAIVCATGRTVNVHTVGGVAQQQLGRIVVPRGRRSWDVELELGVDAPRFQRR